MEYKYETLTANGTRIRAVVEGKGPLCVLVHGWPESWYSWRHQIGPLVDAGYRVCAIDVRGYGGSDKPAAIEAYAMKELTSDVAGVIDALGADQAILIGHDWGAPIVWVTSILHRARVKAVVGLSVPFLGRPPMPPIELWKQVYKDRFFYQIYFQEPGVAEREFEADVRTALRKVYFAASGDASSAEQGATAAKPPTSTMLEGLTDPNPFPAWLSEADLDYFTGEFERSGFRGSLNRYRAQGIDFEALPQLAVEKITQPALFIAGSRDPVLRFIPGVSMLDRMDGHYDDLRGKVVIDGAGHWIQQERPEAVNAAIVEFLKKL
ncbi:MAG TPA: alpha/beta hydrolase [Polyangiaceae bacterium]|jgi:pimeloyl-ACP methyl ester carboxylesterase|nr:alpha/beta hydrolase [Polyangiaceae bacterium]